MCSSDLLSSEMMIHGRSTGLSVQRSRACVVAKKHELEVGVLCRPLKGTRDFSFWLPGTDVPGYRLFRPLRDWIWLTANPAVAVSCGTCPD